MTRKEYDKEYYQKNKAKKLAQVREYRKNNPEKIKKQHINYAKNNPEKVKEINKEYRKKNRDALLEHSAKYWRENRDRLTAQKRAYYDSNKDEQKQKQLEYRAKNRAYMISRTSTYQKNNPDKVKVWARTSRRKRWALIANAEGSHTDKEWTDLVRAHNNKCVSCAKEMREPKRPAHADDRTEDHILPLSKGGSDYIENIQPMCRSCNSAKGATTS